MNLKGIGCLLEVADLIICSVVFVSLSSFVLYYQGHLLGNWMLCSSQSPYTSPN